MNQKARKQSTSRPGDRHRLQYAIRVRVEPDQRAAWQQAAWRAGLTGRHGRLGSSITRCTPRIAYKWAWGLRESVRPAPVFVFARVGLHRRVKDPGDGHWREQAIGPGRVSGGGSDGGRARGPAVLGAAA